MRDDIVIEVVRVPSIIGIAMSIAPLVRRGIITDAEGRALVDLRYRQAWARLSG